MLPTMPEVLRKRGMSLEDYVAHLKNVPQYTKSAEAGNPWVSGEFVRRSNQAAMESALNALIVGRAPGVGRISPMQGNGPTPYDRISQPFRVRNAMQLHQMLGG